tara:strand:- start:96 stop:431 length:336 start_codon:yes stop_codon:yes gene_type:complete
MATKNRKTATEAQVKSWKSKYGQRVKVFTIIESEEKNQTVHKAYFKKPDLVTVQAADAAHPDDPIERNLFQYDNCFLGGDEVFETDDEYKFALANAIARSFRILTGEVKNA